MTESPIETTRRTLKLRDAELYVETSGTGEPLVLLHGFTGCGADWKHVFDLDALARRYRLSSPMRADMGDRPTRAVRSPIAPAPRT